MAESRTTQLLATLSDDGLAFGCDYNPEQWDRDVWREDVRLMREAGVGLVAINIFGWSSINPSRGVWDFAALDEVIDLLHGAGIRLNLGTGTASPPPWLSTAHPEILPMAQDGTTRYPGGRQAFCPSSPLFRDYARELVTHVADRYGDHPAVALWHVSNELGCHNALCYCDESARAFRTWLQDRYETIDALNAAWGTSFWSQRYSAWNEILPPRQVLSLRNPSHVLDFHRFSSDEQLGLYRAEARIIRERSAAPITTNFMVTAHIRNMDYWSWADDMDLIANDHYLDRRLDDPRRELSFAADLTRGLAKGDPWLLMETSTSAVNWQPFNLAKAPGELLRNVTSHIARGADGICFFQWRASAQGSEKFHSALVPHAGTDSAAWREVVQLGDFLRRLDPLRGTRVRADTALLFSWESWWAIEGEGRPSEGLTYLDEVHSAHRAASDAGLTCDIVAPGSTLDGYRFVIVPALHLIDDRAAAMLSDFVAAGGTVLVTFSSGIVDTDDRVRLGGYPGAFRDLLGVRVEEFAPLLPDDQVTLASGARARTWSERMTVTDAEIIDTYADGPTAGLPALTRRASGEGTAWYLSTHLDPEPYRELIDRIAAEAGAVRGPGHEGLEVVRRDGDAHSYLIAINHSNVAAAVPADGRDLITGEIVSESASLPAGAVRIIEEIR